MTAALAASGWCGALVLALEFRRRAGLIADALHELRGPLCAVSLGLESLRRQPDARRRARALLTELDRATVAVQDLGHALRGRRAAPRAEHVSLRSLAADTAAAWRPAAERSGGRVRFEWPAGESVVRADRRRLAQAFGNLLANAVEHGGGDVVVRGRPGGRGMRVEVVDGGGRGGSARRQPGRGRGLVIAERALSDAGGQLESFDRPGAGRVAIAELPLAEAG